MADTVTRIGIPTRNRAHLLEAQIEAIRGQEPPSTPGAWVPLGYRLGLA